MKQFVLITIIFLLFLQYNFCLAQEQITTSYQQKEHPNIHVTLNGKVKILKQTSHNNDPLCDTISGSVDSFYVRYSLCIKDTIIYVFDSNLMPKKINHVLRNRGKSVYDFENGNILSENHMNYGSEYSSQYKYDSNGNMVYCLSCSKNSFPCCESFWEYNNYNRLTLFIRYDCVAASPIKKPICIEILRYDTLGYLIEEIRNDFYNNSYGKWFFIYDVKGNKIEDRYCKGYNGEDKKRCKYKHLQKYIYDENNRLIKEFTVGKRVTPHNVEYKYDEKGNKIEVKGHSAIWRGNNLDFHFVTEYNNDGQRTKEEEKTGNHPLIFTTSSMLNSALKHYSTLITTYDKNKNITQEEYIVNNETVNITRYVYTYDSWGNWIKREKHIGENEENLFKTLVEERVIEYY